MELETVIFKCTLNKPDKEVTWLKNGKQVTSGEHFKPAANGCEHTLTVSEALLDDTDDYTIVAGKVDSKAKLTVEGWRNFEALTKASSPLLIMFSIYG